MLWPYLANFHGFLVISHTHESAGFARVAWKACIKACINEDAATSECNNKCGHTFVKFFIERKAGVRVF